MKQEIREVVIIYNPVSTGPGKRMALKFQRQLKKKLPQIRVDIIPTEYALHAIELAEKHGGANVLLLAASGDGGYNELINGAIKVHEKTGIMPVCGVLPAGHANDHFRTLGDNEDKLLENIHNGKVRAVDLLKAEYTNEKGMQEVRYAHSYIGLGISSYVVKELNARDLNNINDKIITAKSLSKFKPIKIKRRGRIKEIDSLIFTNTGKMARWLTLSEKSRIDDGLFEVQLTPYKSPVYRVKQLIRMVQAKPPKGLQTSSYSFEVDENTLMQLDGEVVALRAGSEVKITSAEQALTTIL